MPAPKKCPDELRERATWLVVEARRDPASSVGAIRRMADTVTKAVWTAVQGGGIKPG